MDCKTPAIIDEQLVHFVPYTECERLVAFPFPEFFLLAHCSSSLILRCVEMPKRRLPLDLLRVPQTGHFLSGLTMAASHPQQWKPWAWLFDLAAFRLGWFMGQSFNLKSPHVSFILTCGKTLLFSSLIFDSIGACLMHSQRKSSRPLYCEY